MLHKLDAALNPRIRTAANGERQLSATVRRQMADGILRAREKRVGDELAYEAYNAAGIDFGASGLKRAQQRHGVLSHLEKQIFGRAEPAPDYAAFEQP